MQKQTQVFAAIACNSTIKGGRLNKREPGRAQNRFSKNLHFKTIFLSPDSVFFILGFFEAFFDFISFFDAYQAS